MEVVGFVTWKRREKGERSRALSHAVQLPSYVIFQRAQTIILWSGLPPQSWVSTLHGIKASQPPPKNQHWLGGTGLEIPVLKLRRMSRENSPDTTPEMISVRINCKIKNICAVSGSHLNITVTGMWWNPLGGLSRRQRGSNGHTQV